MTGQFERLRVFLAVAERGSFAAAARSLRLTRSQATRYVAELEAEIGARLLTRTTRQVALTAAGRVYAERTAPMLAELARAEDLARQQQQTLAGELRVSVPLSFGLKFLPDAISQYRILYPQIRLSLDLTDRFVDPMQDNLDMALRISGPPDDKSRIWRKIALAPRAAAASPGYLQRRGTPMTPEDLKEHDTLVYAQGAEAALWELRHAANGETRTVELSSCFRCNNGELIGKLAERGEGVALLPRFILAASLRSGALVEVLPDWRTPDVWLSAFYPPYDRLPAKVLTFTSFIENAVKADASMLE